MFIFRVVDYIYSPDYYIYSPKEKTVCNWYTRPCKLLLPSLECSYWDAERQQLSVSNLEHYTKVWERKKQTNKQIEICHISHQMYSESERQVFGNSTENLAWHMRSNDLAKSEPKLVFTYHLKYKDLNLSIPGYELGILTEEWLM